MRGKTKASTRFNKFRTDMIVKFRDDASLMSDFIKHLNVPANFDMTIKTWCDESESLIFDYMGGPTSVYQVLRIANRPVLLRELEVFGEYTWGKQSGKNYVYSALSVLYGVNLIDYTFRDFNSTPSNVVQFFVKEED